MTDTVDAVADDDTRHDDLEFNPRLEPTSAKAWLNLLDETEKAFEQWNDTCDRIDKQYASIERLAQSGRDKEFQMFWANVEVLKPNLYAKKPEPVIVPKFKDMRPVPQAASEFLQRCCTVAFDIADIDALMMAVRDDLALIGRGTAWCRYQSGKHDGSYYDREKVCIDYKQRKDFLHGIARTWAEVPWVAAASYLTREAARDRFHEHSGDAYQDAEYTVDRDARDVGGADNRERAKFWEIWAKPAPGERKGRCVWVAKGCDDILDEDEAHLELTHHFPCPRPAYATLQRGSLVPVPDVLQYRDQLEALNLLTARIHALGEALQAKGFYPAGGGEVADAIETAMKLKTSSTVLVPVSNWAAFGGSKEVIIWLPIADIAGTIQAALQVRRQMIEDIYQIMGLSDIMRGATDARETLGAQQLKSQYGSSRVRDKQQELVRFARDLVEITADIICEKFDPVTMIEMAQSDLPTMQMQQEQVRMLQQDLGNKQLAIQQAQQNPQLQGMAQQNPDGAQKLLQAAQQMLQQGKQAIQQIMHKPTIEQVLRFLEDNRARCFVLDIETDSTILVDENAEKQRRAEFMSMLSQLLPQLTQMVMAAPEMAPFAGQLLRFSVAPYRAGRTLDGAIDDAVQLLQQKASQPKGDDPTTAQAKTAKEIEQMRIDYQKERDKGEQRIKLLQLQGKVDHQDAKLAAEQQQHRADLLADQAEQQAKADQASLKAMGEREKQQTARIKSQADMALNASKMQLAQRQAQIKASEAEARAIERHAAQAFRQQQTLQRQTGLVPQ